jgi:hypothetical protein
VSLGRVAALVCRDRSKPDPASPLPWRPAEAPLRPFNPPGAHACAPGWAHSPTVRATQWGGANPPCPLVSHLPEGSRRSTHRAPRTTRVRIELARQSRPTMPFG